MTLKEKYNIEKTQLERAANDLSVLKDFCFAVSRVGLVGAERDALQHREYWPKHFIAEAVGKFINDHKKEILITAATLCLAEIGEEEC